MFLSASLLAAAAIQFVPAGWSQVYGPPGYAVYRPAGGSKAELRLYVEPAGEGDLDTWFRRRMQKPPQGATLASAPGTQPAHRGVASGMAMLKGGAGATMVLAMACKGQDGANRYAELLTTPEAPDLKPHIGATSDLLVHACADPASPAKPVASPPPATTPVKAGPPAAGAVKDGEIEAIVYSWSQIYGIGGLQMTENTYLLLKDGSVRRDLPAERDFDVAASKAREAGRWGRWRKQGAAYQLSFGGGAFQTPPGELVRLPGRPGETLSGQYKTSSSYQIAGGAGSWSMRGVSFTPNGRFSAFNTGGAGGTTGAGDAQIAAANVYDDEGSAGSVAGPNFGGGGARRSGNTAADRQGTYRIDGYTMTLRYDSGRVERSFFYTDPDRRAVFFRGADLLKPRN